MRSPDIAKPTDPAPSSEEMNGTCGKGPVVEFYRGRSILITGATGFMGKVLVEKLLRSCPDIDRIYILMRPKSGRDVRTRLDELLSTTIFDGLRKDRPETLYKIIAISGDIAKPNLGINPTDTKMLVDHVSVVFHSAATVKFDEALKLSVAMNISGTKHIVQLCHKMLKLEALVHVSTAYCNCNRKEVKEYVYPPPNDPDKTIQCVDWMDESLLEDITPKIIGDRPNTYTFTKSLAEYVLFEQSGNLPVSIVRPSIVVAAWKEPIPGWVDNLNGPTGLLAGAGKGILRSMFCNRDMIADLIPVDIAINLIITVGWQTATNRSGNIAVYNCTSGMLNPIRWRDIENFGQEFIKKHPFNEVIWYPGGSFKNNRLFHSIAFFTSHLIPAYIFDLVARLSGRKPIFVRLQRKLQRAVGCLEYFTTNEWHFSNTNVSNLLNKLDERDRVVFDFDVRQLNWRSYIEQYVLGIRHFILKEDPSSLPAARSNMNRMYWIHRIFQFIILTIFWKFVLLRSETFSALYLRGINLFFKIYQALRKFK